MTKLVAIIGATGLQGGSVLKTLYASDKYKLRALTRNPDSDNAKALVAKYPGIELAQADLDDLASLRKAFKNADVVFGMTDFHAVMQRVLSGERDAEFEQGKNIVDAAIGVGVKTLVYSGMDSMTTLSGGKYTDCVHFDNKHKVEEYLNSKSDVIDGFVIYLGYYMENYVLFSQISKEDGQTVEFASPSKPTAKVPLVDTANDTGPVVEYILDHPDECRGVPQEVSTGYFEVQEMADAFTKVTGKPARYVQIPYEALGLEEMSQMFKGIDEFGYFNYRDGFLKRNQKMKHTFTTPTDFWKHRGWTGPAK